MQNIQNLFVYATSNKLRFSSTRGELTIEQLWDLPLSSRDGFNLDAIAIAADKAFKETEVSFVATTKTVEHTRREAVLETVKYIISVKLAEAEAATKRVANQQKRERILRALAEKQEGKLLEMSEKELQEQLAALGED